MKGEFSDVLSMKNEIDRLRAEVLDLRGLMGPMSTVALAKKWQERMLTENAALREALAVWCRGYCAGGENHLPECKMKSL